MDEGFELKKSNPTKSNMFCICGTLVHIKSDSSRIECSRCRRKNSLDMIEPMHVRNIIQKDMSIEIRDVKGAKIKHQCPACNREEMMYSTAQLRSADEGQTVFYSCECGYKHTVQS